MRGKRTRVGSMIWCREFVYLYAPEGEPASSDVLAGPAVHPRILDKLRSGAPRFLLASIGGNEHNLLAIPQAAR